MTQIAIIVFREVVEIILILGILVTATKDIKHSLKWISSGLAASILSCLVLAFFTNKISESFDGMGQELFNGSILLAAAGMISWTVLWIAKHAKEMSKKIKVVSNSIVSDNKPLYILAIITFLTMLREGTEVTLFMYSSYISGAGITNIISGFAIGATLGLTLGTAIYFGILKTFGKHFLRITTWMLVFVACGLTSQAIGFFANTDFISTLTNEAWNSSFILPENSFFGKFLHIFLGYIERPSVIQVLGYLTNLLILIIGFALIKRQGKNLKS